MSRIWLLIIFFKCKLYFTIKFVISPISPMENCESRKFWFYSTEHRKLSHTKERGQKMADLFACLSVRFFASPLSIEDLKKPTIIKTIKNMKWDYSFRNITKTRYLKLDKYHKYAASKGLCSSMVSTKFFVWLFFFFWQWKQQEIKWVT